MSVDANAFSRAVSARGSLSFRSHDGVARRSDNDQELTFFSDGRVEILLFGIKLYRVAARWQLAGDGRIFLTGISWVWRYPKGWPPMLATLDANLWRLDRADAPPRKPGTRALTTDREGTVWPFRQLTGIQERDTLKTIRDEIANQARWRRERARQP